MIARLRCFMLARIGKLSNARGFCPVCGHDVERRHSFNGLRLVESYGCYRCGPTTYTVTASA